MSEQEESNVNPDKYEFWKRLAEDLCPESWDEIYLRQLVIHVLSIILPCLMPVSPHPIHRGWHHLYTLDDG